jgi:hypothetical protein
MNGRRYIIFAGLAPLAALVVAGSAAAQDSNTVVEHKDVQATTPSGETVTEHSTSVTQSPPAYSTSQTPSTSESKTVTHRDENGDVTRQTHVERSENPDGSSTTVRRTDEAPPLPPAD